MDQIHPGNIKFVFTDREKEEFMPTMKKADHLKSDECTAMPQRE
jgi:hypothetical protein